MNEFDDVEAALGRYQPAVSSGALARIAHGLAASPSLWRRPWILAAAAVVVLSLPAAWWAMSRLGQRQPASVADVPASFATAWKSLPRVSIPGIDTKAAVVVVGFNDWQCPGCLELYVALEALFADYEKTHPGTVARILLDWPWNLKCNPYAPAAGHAHACEAAAAVRVAREHGQADQLVEWLRENRQLVDSADGADRIIRKTKELLPRIDVDALLPAQAAGIARDVEIGRHLSIAATPTYFINGVKIGGPQLPTVQAFEWAIRLELAKAGH